MTIGSERFAAVIAYDGTDLAGWQRQANRASVQGLLESAVAGVAGVATPVTGAGRTDGGVHATAQVAHFDITWHRPTEGLAAALNAGLPAAVVIRRVVRVDDSFHARHSATGRAYRYVLWVGDQPDPFGGRWAHPVGGPLHVAWMRAAAAAFVGSHDFGAFGRAVTDGGTTIRRVDRCTVWADGPRMVCAVEANAFLRHQVRRMVASLVAVGQGRLAPEDVRRALWGAPDQRPRGRVPASGLTLTAVRYPPRYSVLLAGPC